MKISQEISKAAGTLDAHKSGTTNQNHKKICMDTNFDMRDNICES